MVIAEDKRRAEFEKEKKNKKDIHAVTIVWVSTVLLSTTDLQEPPDNTVTVDEVPISVLIVTWFRSEVVSISDPKSESFQDKKKILKLKPFSPKGFKIHPNKSRDYLLERRQKLLLRLLKIQHLPCSAGRFFLSANLREKGPNQRKKENNLRPTLCLSLRPCLARPSLKLWWRERQRLLNSLERLGGRQLPQKEEESCFLWKHRLCRQGCPFHRRRERHYNIWRHSSNHQYFWRGR